jgi:hypothetical protein
LSKLFSLLEMNHLSLDLFKISPLSFVVGMKNKIVHSWFIMIAYSFHCQAHLRSSHSLKFVGNFMILSLKPLKPLEHIVALEFG